MSVKAPPVWNPPAFASFWINHASRLLMRQLEEALAPLELTMAYSQVAFALDEDRGLLQRDLAARAHVEQPTMAALLARMERDGLLAREPHPSDKRATRIRLTAKAKGRVPEARRRMHEVAERLTAGFTEEERATFLELLQRAVRNLGEDVDAILADDVRSTGGPDSP